MDNSNEHIKNRSQKQLTETPDSQFNNGFQYTIPFYCFLIISSTNLFVTLIIQVIQYS